MQKRLNEDQEKVYEEQARVTQEVYSEIHRVLESAMRDQRVIPIQ